MSSTENIESNGHGQDTRSRLQRLLPVAVMLALVTLAAVLPLVRNAIFYFWDDTAAATVPVWRRIGEAVLDGRLPIMEPDMWRGGAFAAEASTGIFNPLMVALAVATYPIDDMALAITVAKIFFILVLALGSYLLARAFRVRPWLAVGMGLATPLASQTFYWDASSWMYSLMATAFTPWVWWTIHRAVHTGGSWIWVVVSGYLMVSLGNPYGLLAVGVMVLSYLVQCLVIRKRDKIVGLFVSGAAVALTAVPIFLPLLLTSPVGSRAGAATYNDDFLAPNLSDLMTMSTPTAQPWMTGFTWSFLAIPAVYLAWFVLPMLPWMRWRVVRQDWQRLLPVMVFAAVYLPLVLGPSQIWMFRWPLRLVTDLWFPVLLLWFVVANAGLERTKVKLRAGFSLGIVFLGGWLAWSDVPDHRNRIAAGCLVVAVFVALLAWRGVASRSGIAALLTGSIAVLGVQLYFYPKMSGVTEYQFPTSQSQIKDRFSKYEGLTIQVAAVGQDEPSDALYSDVLFGSQYSVAGVSSTSEYSGIAFSKMDQALCMVYQGSTCGDAWARLWQPVEGYREPMVDLMRAQTVVVQNSLVDTRNNPEPPGWRRDKSAETSGKVTVYKRIKPLAFPQGTVSQTSAGVTVGTAVKTSVEDERVTYTRPKADGDASMTFARLAWPGYTATVNGQPANVRMNSIGLVVVDLPRGTTSGTVELDYTMPGKTTAIASVLTAVVLTLGLVGFTAFTRRRSRTTSAGPADAAEPPTLPARDPISASRDA